MTDQERIAALEAEAARLREALERITNTLTGYHRSSYLGDNVPCDGCVERDQIAEAALRNDKVE